MTHKIRVGENEVDLPDGIEVVSAADNLFLVPYEMTFVNRPEKTLEGGGFDFGGLTCFFNPRRMTGEGFDPQAMQELYEDMKEEGLLRNLFSRWVLNGGVLKAEVLDGERRHVTAGRLRERNELCFDRRRGTMLPALEVYGKLLMEVRDLGEDAAFQIAYSVSERQVPWGEGNNAMLVRHWREQNQDDASILARTKRSGQWLREQDQINELDDKTFQYLVQRRINRSVALKLCRITDIEERHRYLDATYADAVAGHAKTYRKLDTEIKKAEEIEEVADANVAAAEAGFGSVEKAREELTAAKKVVQEKKKKLDALEPPQAKTGNLRRGASTVADKAEPEDRDDGDDGETGGTATATKPATGTATGLKLPLKTTQIATARESIDALIKVGGKVGDTKVVIPVHYLIGAKAALDAVVAGEEDVLKKVRRAYEINRLLEVRAKSQAMAKEVAVEDELEEEIENEDEEEIKDELDEDNEDEEEDDDPDAWERDGDEDDDE